MAKKSIKRRRRLTKTERKMRKRKYIRKYNALPEARDAKRRYRNSPKGRPRIVSTHLRKDMRLSDVMPSHRRAAKLGAEPMRPKRA